MLATRRRYSIAIIAFISNLTRVRQASCFATMAPTTKMKGIMMILSPAKTLDLNPFENADKILGKLSLTEPDCDVDKTLEVAKEMKQRKEGELGKLLGISANLAKTASGYWKSYSDKPSVQKELKPCIFSFSGAAYQGLQIHECDQKALEYLQNCLRIIDPLYGVLRPLDRMQPYRLEMATKGVFSSDKKIKLADFWSGSVTKRLSEELSEFDDPILLNVASDEYSAAVDTKSLPLGARYIKAVFQVDGRVVAVHAKRARGLMVRFLAEKQASSVDDIKKFDSEGYAFDESKSDESTLVFGRSKDQAASKRPATSTSKATAKKSKR